MSCERRTEFDRKMQEMHDPMKKNNNYHAAPLVGFRTTFDQKLQKKWCPSCVKKGHNYSEGFAPLVGFRTKFDQKLQKKWCMSCDTHNKPHHYGDN